MRCAVGLLYVAVQPRCAGLCGCGRRATVICRRTFGCFLKNFGLNAIGRGLVPECLRGSRQERGEALELNVAQRLACECAQRFQFLRSGDADTQARVGWPVGIKPKATISEAVFPHRPHVSLQHAVLATRCRRHWRCREPPRTAAGRTGACPVAARSSRDVIPQERPAAAGPATALRRRCARRALRRGQRRRAPERLRDRHQANVKPGSHINAETISSSALQAHQRRP